MKRLFNLFIFITVAMLAGTTHAIKFKTTASIIRFDKNTSPDKVKKTGAEPLKGSYTKAEPRKPLPLITTKYIVSGKKKVAPKKLPSRSQAGKQLPRKKVTPKKQLQRKKPASKKQPAKRPVAKRPVLKRHAARLVQKQTAAQRTPRPVATKINSVIVDTTFYCCPAGDVTVRVITNKDISQHTGVDGIVNAANSTLIGAAGVSKAIQDAAGTQLIAALKKIPFKRPGIRCATGDAVITPAFNLARNGLKNIIHCVGPMGSDPRRAELLRKTYTKILELANKHKLSSIAIPTISTGIFGYPEAEAAKIAVETITKFITSSNNKTIKRVDLIVWGDSAFNLYFWLLHKAILKHEHNYSS